jgi:Protein of unknown function (DUF2510)
VSGGASTPWPYSFAVLADVNGSGVLGGGIFAIIFVFFAAVSIGSVVFLIIALVDIVRRPEWQWKLAGQEKILWIVLVVVVNFLAIPSFIYWFNIRKKLIVVEQAAASGQLGPGQMTYAGWVPGPGFAPMATGLAPAGWNPDPNGQSQYRWWDGFQWTDHTWSAEPPTT